MPIITKFVEMVMYCVELPPIESYGPLVMWSYEVTQQI